jgi:hypothetical protein
LYAMGGGRGGFALGPGPLRTGRAGAFGVFGRPVLLEGEAISRVVEAIEKQPHLVDFGPPLSADHPHMLVVRADGFVDPCIPTLAAKPPAGPGWVHEIKHDGYRLIVRWDGRARSVRLGTRELYHLGPLLGFV